MRKQNSVFKTAFLSEAGAELENNDYFAYVELEKYACYVIADGLNELPDAKSARLAIESVILAFQEHPSIRKQAVLSYMKAANQELSKADSRERLKASVTVVVSDYAKFRYAYTGNTRLRLYREGKLKERTQDMSLSRELMREERISVDALAKHEERNNLYSYAGQGKGFTPIISRKIKWAAGDILTLYTRGIWENLDEGELDDVFSEAKDDPQECLDNIEDLLLSRQPKKLVNYTFTTIFADKIFRDPNRKRRLKKIIITSLVVAAVVFVICLIFWLFHRQRLKRIEEMNLKYTDTIEYIQDSNYVRAEELCQAAIKTAEKLRDKKATAELSEYLKLIEAVNAADDSYGEKNYEEAQSAYLTARERSRYADHVADDYIDKRLSTITDYLSVFDYIQLGDTLTAQKDFTRAEEKYLKAKSLATRVYFEDGRKEAMDALEQMYTERDVEEDADTQEAKEKAENETGAAELMSQGDKAFADGDYDGANVFYAMAIEKYQQLGDTAHADLLNIKIQSCRAKFDEISQKETQADSFLDAALELEEAKEYMEAKKQYLFAKNLYKELKLDSQVETVNGRLEILNALIEQDKAEQERLEKEAEKETGAKNIGTGGPGSISGQE